MHSETPAIWWVSSADKLSHLNKDLYTKGICCLHDHQSNKKFIVSSSNVQFCSEKFRDTECDVCLCLHLCVCICVTCVKIQVVNWDIYK